MAQFNYSVIAFYYTFILNNFYFGTYSNHEFKLKLI